MLARRVSIIRTLGLTVTKWNMSRYTLIWQQIPNRQVVERRLWRLTDRPELLVH